MRARRVDSCFSSRHSFPGFPPGLGRGLPACSDSVFPLFSRIGSGLSSTRTTFVSGSEGNTVAALARARGETRNCKGEPINKGGVRKHSCGARLGPSRKREGKPAMRARRVDSCFSSRHSFPGFPPGLGRGLPACSDSVFPLFSRIGSGLSSTRTTFVSGSEGNTVAALARARGETRNCKGEPINKGGVRKHSGGTVGALASAKARQTLPLRGTVGALAQARNPQARGEIRKPRGQTLPLRGTVGALAQARGETRKREGKPVCGWARGCGRRCAGQKTGRGHEGRRPGDSRRGQGDWRCAAGAPGGVTGGADDGRLGQGCSRCVRRCGRHFHRETR
jgi:hypothetical protein